MLIGKNTRPEIGKWKVLLSVSDDFQTMWPLTKNLTFIAMKLKKRPPEGVEFRPEDYRGIIFMCRFVVPFSVSRWR